MADETPRLAPLQRTRGRNKTVGERQTVTITQYALLVCLADGSYRAGVFHARTIKSLRKRGMIDQCEIALTPYGAQYAQALIASTRGSHAD